MSGSAGNPSYKRNLSLAGVATASASKEDLIAGMRRVLQEKIHGLSFSPYLSGQKPGSLISEDQIRERLAIIQPYVKWVRSFSCTDGHQAIGRIAHSMGLKTMVGAWLDDDEVKNEQELDNAIAVAQAGHANIVAVGNEVLLRNELSEDALIAYMARVKDAVPDVQVAYVDAYFQFVDHPRVTEACDVILANCYPFWEGCAADYSLLYMKDMYRRVMQVANGKKIIISETGWPNVGTPTAAAVPSEINAIRYFIAAYQWAQEEGIDIIYFSSFDEDWKVGDEGDVGAYWGLWDKHGQFKYT